MPANISKYEFYRIHYVCFERSLIYLNNSDVVNRKMTEFFFREKLTTQFLLIATCFHHMCA